MSDLHNASVLVSVIVPAYNGERTIDRTLSSIARQSYRPLELIIVDDASKDLTASLAKNFCVKNKFDCKLIVHQKNVGLSKTLNDGVKEARGGYMLILHQDCELAKDDWIERAVNLMADESVAIVTGYYGIAANDDINFVKRAFGVLRKQFHSRPSISDEEVTFSEGKCDLYRRDILLKVGGFPTRYRIAGEDLVLSYRLRSMGYKIIKSYDLPVIQRFGGKAESLLGNLEKEFLFGKVMGGVFSEFKLFLFKGLRDSMYSRARSLHRASQPLFVSALITALAMFMLFRSEILLFLVIAILIGRCFYYLFRVFGELKIVQNLAGYQLAESFMAALLGVLTDFVYSLGFGYGFILYQLGKKL